ncbi:MAG: DoxX family protein [Rhodospirillales bacterium]|jgi:putative oxidoreductase|nr:DoxX-like protein [Rhodospirillaceae bacterium]MDP6428800.1 DoxX family protein [Rhodospirillales bacterium]MDP6643239.1 DoxX family protein [Rhodospirillales bacterium]MDP6840907.1 DoxX family protein [Rhodospirillales bacterium]|tara:strand:+ start:1187 stop:1672 length:486 start_codon:yes stop_codon:yes gene_type:complete
MNDQIDRSGLYIPGLGGIYDSLSDLAYPILRIAMGAWYIPHGWVKIIGGGVAKYNDAGALVGGTAGFMAKMNFPIPEVLAWYIGLLELVGGALLVLGLLTRLVAIQYVGFMLVAAIFVHKANWFWTGRGMEMPLLLLVIAVVLFIRGGGNLSIDKSMSKEF